METKNNRLKYIGICLLCITTIGVLNRGILSKAEEKQTNTEEINKTTDTTIETNNEDKLEEQEDKLTKEEIEMLNDKVDLIPQGDELPKEIKDNIETKTTTKASLKTERGLSIVDFKVPDDTIVAGTTPFDTKEGKGLDKRADNGIVRTFDTVSYKPILNIASTGDVKYSNIKYKVTATYKSAWYEDGNQVREIGRFKNDTLKNIKGDRVIDSVTTTTGVMKTPGIVSYPILFDVKFAKDGQVLKPEFKVDILEATNDKTGQVEKFSTLTQTEVNESVTVTAREDLRAELAPSSNTLSSVNALFVDDKDKGKYNGLVMNVGVSFYTPNMSTIDNTVNRPTNDFRGMTIPTGPYKAVVKSDGFVGSYPIKSGVDDEGFKVFQYGMIKPATSNNSWTTKDYLMGDYFKGLNTRPMSILQPLSVLGSGYKNMQVGDHVFYSGESTKEWIEVKELDANNIEMTLHAPYLVDKHATNGIATSSNGFLKDKKYVGTGSYYLYQPMKATETNKGDYKAQIIMKEVSSNTTKPYISDQIYSWTYNTDFYTSTQGALRAMIDSALIPSNIKTSWQSANDGTVTPGQQLFYSSTGDAIGYDIKYKENLTMWNPTTFYFNHNGTNRDYSQVMTTQSAEGKILERKYGVYKKGEKFDYQMSNLDKQYAKFDWYTNREEARKAGEITAIWDKAEKLTMERFFKTRLTVPLNVQSDAKIGTNYDKNGIDNTIVNLQKLETHDGKIKQDATNYIPPVFDENGKQIKQSNRPNSLYEHVYVNKYKARLQHDIDSTTYASNQEIPIVLNSFINAPKGTKPTVEYTLLIPDKVKYLPGSVEYGGQPVNTPPIIEQKDGYSEHKWRFEVNGGEEWNRQLKLKVKAEPGFEYNAQGVGVIEIKSYIGIVGKEPGDEKIKNTEFLDRTRKDVNKNVRNVSEFYVDLQTDKTAIETDKYDNKLNTEQREALVSLNYTIDANNNTSDKFEDVRILNVLPNEKDNRGTTYKGGYDLKQVNTSSDNSEAYYTNKDIDINTKPSDIDLSKDWKKVETKREISENDVKAVMVLADIEPQSKEQVDLTVLPKDVKEKDIFVNNATISYNKNMVLESPDVKIVNKVRYLDGFAFKSNYKDGVYNVQRGDQVLSNVEVGILRRDEETNKYEFLKETLTKQLLYDDKTKKSTIKTDDKGFYEVKNLPKGDYKVQFRTSETNNGRYVVSQKHPLTSQNTNTNKVDTDMKSEVFNMPEVGNTKFEDGLYKQSNVNLGLERKNMIKLIPYDKSKVKMTNQGTPELGDNYTLVNKDAYVSDNKYTIKDKDGKVVKIVKGAKNETTTVTDLEIGVYTVDFEKDNTKYDTEYKTQTINVDGVSPVYIEFKRNIIYAPKTGVNAIIPMTITTTVGVLGYLYVRRGKNELDLY